MYRTSWIAAKAVDCVAEDMVKNWIEFTGEIQPKDIEKLNAAIKRTATKAKVLEALKWSRLFGGSVALIIIDGQTNFEEPLDIESIGPGDYKGLDVFDRWSGVTPSSQISTDVMRPLEFGLPQYYTVSAEGGEPIRVHASRLLRFTGPELPRWERQAQMYWGISIFERLFPELQKRDNLSWSLISLVFRANVFAMKHKGLSQMLSLGSANQQQNFVNTMQSISLMMSNQGILVTPDEGGLDHFQASFGSLPELYQTFMLDICGCLNIPMTRLFGRTATGLGQSNDGDEDIYFDYVSQLQEDKLSPALYRLLPIIAMSELGHVPDDLDHKCKPIQTLSAPEKADLVDKTTKTVIEGFNASIISQQTAMKELQQQSSVTGVFTNITDEMIAAADDTLMTPMEQQVEMAKELEPEGDEGEKKPSSDAPKVAKQDKPSR